MEDTQLITSQDPELPVGAGEEGRATRSRAQTRKSKVWCGCCFLCPAAAAAPASCLLLSSLR